MCPARVTWGVMSAGERGGWSVSDEGRCWKAGCLALSDNFLLRVTRCGGREDFGAAVSRRRAVPVGRRWRVRRSGGGSACGGRAMTGPVEVVTAAVDEAVAADVAGSRETSGCLPPSSSR